MITSHYKAIMAPAKKEKRTALESLFSDFAILENGGAVCCFERKEDAINSTIMLGGSKEGSPSRH